jgi:hypothetical protein
MRAGFAAPFALLALLGCPRAPQPRTPEDVIAGGTPGSSVWVEGTAFTVTFDNAMVSADSFPAGADRFVLLRTVKPKGVTMKDLNHDALVPAFGLGVHLAPADLAARRFRLPEAGDLVRVKGTFGHATWKGHTVPVIESPTELTVTKGAPAPAEMGASCGADMDCRDELVCDRATARCAAAPPRDWGSPEHDVNGACDGDADCPIGQSCDPAFAIAASGTYAAHYRATEDSGRHLCVPAPGLGQAALCPRTGTAADLAGGRYAQGKEVCIRGAILLYTHADDGDTHVQLLVDEPLPYPASTVGYDVFGATSENSPPSKDPARPGGAVEDPPTGQPLVVIGTYRYDDGHGWFELHPIKAWWPAP